MAIFSEDQAARYRTTLCATWPDQASDERVATLTTSPPDPWSFYHGREVRSFVSPKHRRRIFNEIKFHPKGGSQPTANPFALFHSTLLRAPFRITFREQAEALQFFKLSMHREFPFHSTQPSTRSKSIRSAVCLDVLRSTGRYFLFSIFLSSSSSCSLDTMSFLFSAATLLRRIFFDTRVSLDISARLSYYPKGKIRYLRCLNVSPVETSACEEKRGTDNGTALLGEENFGNRRLFRLASDERAQLVSKIIIRKLDSNSSFPFIGGEPRKIVRPCSIPGVIEQTTTGEIMIYTRPGRGTGR